MGMNGQYSGQYFWVYLAAFGWMLAYPTARLRTDYFAIVTISLGEILRVILNSEPLVQSYNTKHLGPAQFQEFLIIHFL